MSSQLRQFMPRVVHSGTTSALCSIPAADPFDAIARHARAS